jgi:hypothetical protein
MQHTFATWAIEEGSVHLWQLAKIMGTSVAQLEDTYARWRKRTDRAARRRVRRLRRRRGGRRRKGMKR